MNEHTSLYEYWRSLLMEEQHNEERNNRLMRKLDEIELRTSMLNERSERLKQLRENLSDLIRQRYLSEDEADPGGNFFSKNQDYSPPEYIPDPILLGLSTPPWVGYDPTKPLVPPKQDSIPKWTSPTLPPAVPSAPPMGSSPETARPTSNDKVLPTSREEEKGVAKQKVTWMNQFPSSGADFSLFEPSISWLPDGSEFYRTTSALENRPTLARPAYCREETKSVVPPPPPSVMSQYSYYVPNTMAVTAQTKEVVSTSTTIPDLHTMQITHTTDVLLSEDTRRDTSEKLEDRKTKPQETTRKEPKIGIGGTKQIGDRGKSIQQSLSESSKQVKKTEGQEHPIRPPRNPNRRRAPMEPLKQETKKVDLQTTKCNAHVKVGTKQQDASKKETSEEDSSEHSKTTFKESSYRQDLYEQKQQLDKEERETDKSEAENAVPKAVTWKNDAISNKPQDSDITQKDTSGSTRKDTGQEREIELVDADNSRFQKDTMHIEGSQDKGDKQKEQTARSSKPREIGRAYAKKQRSSTSSSSSSSTSSSSSSSSSSSKESIRREAAALSDAKANLSEDNSEDSFFDKEVAMKDTTAYHMLLGQKQVATKEQTPASEHPSESSNEIENELVVAVMSTQSPKQKAKDPDKTSDHGSNASTPPEYDVAAVNVHNLISARVRQKVPSLLSRTVLGLDMYSAPALPRKKSDDDDSFFD